MYLIKIKTMEKLAAGAILLNAALFVVLCYNYYFNI